MYLSGTVKVLHLSADYFVYYECVGNQVDEFGACARDAEYVEINSRRRGINAADMRMLQQVVTSQTCVDTSQFVRMNQTRESIIANTFNRSGLSFRYFVSLQNSFSIIH